MGTRALVTMHEHGEEIVVMYRQFDGYPEGLGADLAAFLKPFTITNGIPLNAEMGDLANGMGCLSAQIVAHFKTNVGNIYLYPAGTRNVGEEYIYKIEYNESGGVDTSIYDIIWSADSHDKTIQIFSGSPSELAKFCEEK